MTETSGLSKTIKPIKNRNTRGRTPDGKPNPIDIHAGQRLRMRRQLLGLSQEKLAEMTGLTFQQIQKYERGENRMGASRLWDMAKILEVSIGFFFEDMPLEIAGQSPRHLLLAGSTVEVEDEEKSAVDDPMTRAESYELVHSYYRINNRSLAESLKKSICEAAKNGYLYGPDREDEPE